MYYIPRQENKLQSFLKQTATKKISNDKLKILFNAEICNLYK
jgi:hypothetical protein